MNSHPAGFTLIELLITVAIIAILAAIAVPNYSDYVIRGRIPEATTGLSTIRTQMEQRYQDERAYTAAACTAAMRSLNVTGANFSFTCQPGAGNTPQTFVATATGITTQSMHDFTYTIDQVGNRITSRLPTAAWGSTPVNCWVTRKGGLC